LRSHKTSNRFTGVLEFRRHPITQLMNAAMNVRVVLFETLDQFLNYDTRLLGCCRRVEINKGPIVRQSLCENRKVTTNGFDVKRCLQWGSHEKSSIEKVSNSGQRTCNNDIKTDKVNHTSKA
jgi:hypothetical protein